MFRGILKGLFFLLFPSECASCGAPSASGFCRGCLLRLRPLEEPLCRFEENFHFDRALACFPYEGRLRKALHAFKFGRRRHLNAVLGPLMARLAQRHADRVDAVASVPMDRGAFKARGFNQAELLSRAVAKDLGLPDLSRHVRRVRAARPQHFLPAAERRANVAGGFGARPDAFAGRHVLLVDDVLTTGHTASECAKALKTSGAVSVTVLACARAV
ncbi:MAG: hypothetical protein A3C53_05485 [Omnitrophica WOR_2 bacterium RIFCSPHIGHO2_02_FULL_68_15]|nr:MAG: hypothetical protein A3C53_05485 [Omnitrophica WOR_2 bacterium RIFCSPHIGHO2_02_FULL_68_15]